MTDHKQETWSCDKCEHYIVNREYSRCWSCEDGSEFVADSFARDKATVHDAVNHPAHYTSHPSGIEVIQITEHENFCVGNAIKYLLRAGKKGSKIEDLQKAGWYITREIERLENG